MRLCLRVFRENLKFIYFQVDEQGYEANRRGLYVKKGQRTIGSMCGHNHRFKSAGKSAKMKDCPETRLLPHTAFRR